MTNPFHCISERVSLTKRRIFAFGVIGETKFVSLFKGVVANIPNDQGVDVADGGPVLVNDRMAGDLKVCFGFFTFVGADRTDTKRRGLLIVPPIASLPPYCYIVKPMRSLIRVLIWIGLFAGPSAAFCTNNCSEHLLQKTRQTISDFRILQSRVDHEFHGFRVDPMLAFELLVVSEMRGEDIADGWVLLKDVRDQVGVDVLDTTAKRAIASLFDYELWESKENPARRTEKLVRPTGKGREVLSAILNRE